MDIQMKNGHNLIFSSNDAEEFRDRILELRDGYKVKFHEKTNNDAKPKNNFFCNKCGKSIEKKVYDWSNEYLEKPLCRDCQGSEQQKKLFIAMRECNIPCEYEAPDVNGKKHVDIAIHEIKLYIEVDGRHHNFSPEQFLRDIDRDKYSSINGYQTKHIPNKDIDDDLDSIVDAIAQAYNELKKIVY
jgi:very-short-patch-repair endonuclease